MNKILKTLIASDLLIFSGFGLIAPIFAIYMKDDLVGGSIFAAGIASGIFLITHAILQIFFAYKFNARDRLWMLLWGSALIAIVPFGYIFATNINHIYIIQFIYGLGASFAYPSWYSLFTTNLEKGKTGFQWSIYNSSIGIGTAITAAVGAWLAEKTSFELVFILTGIISLIGFFVLFELERKELKRKILTKV
jgi:MFS family permease